MRCGTISRDTTARCLEASLESVGSIRSVVGRSVGGVFSKLGGHTVSGTSGVPPTGQKEYLPQQVRGLFAGLREDAETSWTSVQGRRLAVSRSRGGFRARYALTTRPISDLIGRPATSGRRQPWILCSLLRVDELGSVRLGSGRYPRGERDRRAHRSRRGCGQHRITHRIVRCSRHCGTPTTTGIAGGCSPRGSPSFSGSSRSTSSRKHGGAKSVASRAASGRRQGAHRSPEKERFAPGPP